MSPELSTGEVEVSVRNLGGIESTTVELSPGVTVLEGRNATNRTSLLQAIAAALGSDRGTLKGDAEEGEVRLQIGEETFTRTFRRTDGGVVTGGEPYLADGSTADLFAFLFGSNEARRAVVEGADLRELVMRPVDTAAIEAEVRRLREERDRLDDRLADLEDLEGRLPDLEARRRELTDQIETTRADLAEVREAVESLSDERRRERREELDERLSTLTERREELESVAFDLETERESLAALREEREQLAAELASVEETDDRRLASVEATVESLRERRRSLESTVDELDRIVEFNRGMLSGDRPAVLDELGGDDPVDGLLADDERSVVCWTCGSEVEGGAVEATIDRLRSLRSDLVAERDDLDRRLAERRDEADDLRERRERRASLQERRERVADELAEREAAVDRLEERHDRLAATVEELEAEVADLEADLDDELPERRREKKELEFELDRLEEERDDLDEEIARVESRLADREALAAEREAVADELVEQRTRVENVERRAVEAFNEDVERLLDLLDYDNVERVWIERREHGGETVFDLHVVRVGEDGHAYEDGVDTLSESEREVVGLVFALAGYLANDVAETVPVLLLDSLEAIDAERIATLVEEFADRTTYLVAALLPDDAAAVDADRVVADI
jgi:predicted  nucleic acid-binding Zn-ribbon protein